MVQQMPEYACSQVLAFLVRYKASWLACRILCKMCVQFGKSVLQEGLLKLIPHDRATYTWWPIAWYAKVLAATSEKGDTTNIQCFLKGLESPAGHTQISCLSYLAQVTPSGDAFVTHALMDYIDKHEAARSRLIKFYADFCLLYAFEALRKIVDPDDSQAIRFLVDNIFFTYVDDTGRPYWEEHRRMPVVDALVELGKVGDRDVVNMLAARLRMTMPNTSEPQIDVLNAVAKLTNEGNSEIINALLSLFSFAEDENDCSLTIALEATILKVVQPCDRSVMPELLRLLRDPNMRHDAVRAVTRATRGDYVCNIKLDWEGSMADEGEGDFEDNVRKNSRTSRNTFAGHS